MAKFCTKCGKKLEDDFVACPECGTFCDGAKAEAAASQAAPQAQPTPIVVNVENNVAPKGKKCDKWVAFFLCWFLGCVGGHKFYEGKTLMGIIYLFTGGLFGIGALVDFFVILTKPNPYYV